MSGSDGIAGMQGRIKCKIEHTESQDNGHRIGMVLTELSELMETDASRMGGAEAGAGVDELWYWSAGKTWCGCHSKGTVQLFP